MCIVKDKMHQTIRELTFIQAIYCSRENIYDEGLEEYEGGLRL